MRKSLLFIRWIHRIGEKKTIYIRGKEKQGVRGWHWFQYLRCENFRAKKRTYIESSEDRKRVFKKKENTDQRKEIL